MRVLIAEDSVLLRDGIIRLLEDRGHEVVWAASDADSAYGAFADDIAPERRPEVAVLDVRMPPTHTEEGLRLAVELHDKHDLPVLVLSQYVEERYATDLLASGARGVGYLLKDRVADVGEFVRAVEEVAKGGTALDPEVVAQIFVRSRRQADLDRLTPREREVLGRMAEGRTNQAIAEHLVVSDGAVEKHVSNIFTKLGLETNDADHRRVLAVLTWLGNK